MPMLLLVDVPLFCGEYFPSQVDAILITQSPKSSTLLNMGLWSVTPFLKIKGTFVDWTMPS